MTGITFVLWFLHQVLMVKARGIYRRVVASGGYLGNRQQASFREMDRRMLLYPLVFFFCWGPGLCSARRRRGSLVSRNPSESVLVFPPQRWRWRFSGW